jgi:large subunit ribosomal protein L23
VLERQLGITRLLHFDDDGDPSLGIAERKLLTGVLARNRIHHAKILVGPLLTEKSGEGSALKTPKYTFKVAVDSNKVEIRKAIETAFKVKVLAVNTIVNKGKRKRLRSAKFGRRPDWKKAVVTLAEGQSINLI